MVWLVRDLKMHVARELVVMGVWFKFVLVA